MIHADAHALLAAGRALDDLAADEAAEYEAHRRACRTCADLEQELELTLADLALAVPARPLPPNLLHDVLEAVRASEAPSVVPFAAGDAPADQQPGERTRTAAADRFASRRLTVGSLALAAAMTLVAVGLGVRSASLESQLEAAGSQIAALRERVGSGTAVLALAASPDHVAAALHAEPLAPGATATVLYRPGTDEAYLVAHGLPPTPVGRVYQLWVADGTGVHALGTFTHDGDGPFVAPFGLDLRDSEAAMVTLEPLGGAQGEPGPQVVFGEI